MPYLLDAGLRPSQTESVGEGPERKEAEGVETVAIAVHGLEGQVCSDWDTIAEDGDTASGLLVEEHVKEQQVPEEARENLQDKGEDESLFGPHSPRLRAGPAADEPIVEDASETASDVGLDTAQVAEGGPPLEEIDGNPLSLFLASVSKPVDRSLLSSPPPKLMQKISGKMQADAGDDTKKRSARLAAKPSAGWSAMDKAQVVLLKKSGILEEDASPQAAHLQRYRKMYTKLLPPTYIEAVTALVETNVGCKIKPSEMGLLAA
jgi:hypothetical protein